MERRETQFLLPNRILRIIYYVLGVLMVTAYALRRDFYHLAISIGTIAVPPLVDIAHRLLKLKPCGQLNFLILMFTFIAYPLGGCLDLYRHIPGFDKVAHTLSGVFVSVLCLALYYLLKPGHAIEKADLMLAASFTFLGSMAIAGLWELGEYAVSAIVRMDLQRVRTTGISDTMNDMLVCMAGTIAALPAVKHISEGKNGLISSAVRSFIEINTQ